MNIIISQTTSEKDKLYDQECKEVLSHKSVLSCLLHTFASDDKTEELEKKLEHKQDLDRDLSILHEGKMICDVYFSFDVSNQTRLYVNVEAQNEANPRLFYRF
ncbi:MAG: hypothetical protein KBT48_01070 [Firmicutes bacterium]|nr:hypothetical protein [Bacillota bacterium]